MYNKLYCAIIPQENCRQADAHGERGIKINVESWTIFISPTGAGNLLMIKEIVYQITSQNTRQFYKHKIIKIIIIIIIFCF